MSQNDQIDLLVDVNVKIDKLTTDAKDIETKVQKAVGNIKSIKVNPSLAVEFKNIDSEVAKVSKALSEKFSKLSGQSKIALNLGDALKKEFDGASGLIDTQGKVIGSKLREFLKQSLADMGASTRLDKRQTLYGKYVELEGLNIADARKMLSGFTNEVGQFASKLEAAQAGLSKSLEQSHRTLKLGIQAATSGVSSSVKAATKDIEALAGALKLADPASHVTRLVADPTPSVENYKRLVEVLTKARESVALMGAQAHNSDQYAQELGLSTQELAVKLSILRTELDKQIPVYKTLLSEELKKEQVDKTLIASTENVAKAQANASVAISGSLEKQIARYTELYAAQKKLESLPGQASVKDTGSDLTGKHLAELKLQQKALGELREAQDALSRQAGLGINEELAARERLHAVLIKYKDILQQITGTEVTDSAKIIQQLDARIAKDEALANAEQKVADKEAAALANVSSSLQTQIRLQTELAQAVEKLEQIKGTSRTGSQQAFQEIANLKERLRLEEQEIRVLEQLRTAAKAYQDNKNNLTFVAVGNKPLSGEGFAQSQKAIKDYENALKSAQVIQGQLTSSGQAEVAMLTQSWERQKLAVRDMMSVQEQMMRLQASATKFSTAEGDAAKLVALREQAAALQKIVDILGVQGRVQSIADRHLLESSRIALSTTNDQIAGIQRHVAETNRLGSSYTSLTSAFRSFLRYAVEMAAFYKAMMGIQAVTASVIDLDNAMKSVQAIARATDTEMEAVGASIKRVAIDTQFSTNEIAQAAQTLAQAGVEIREVGDALDATAQFASATNSSLATSTDILTTMKDVFNDMSFTEIADQMTATINLSKLTAEELSTILSRAVQVSDTFHIIPAQMNAAFAVLRNAGIKASTISTGYRESLLELFSPDKKTLDYLEKRYSELGQNLSRDAIQSLFQGFASASDPIRAAAEELNKLGFATSAASEFSRVFSVRAKNVLDVLVKQQSEYTSLTTQISSHGAAAKGAATQMESLGHTWENLGSVITAVASNSFGTALDGIQKLVKGFSDLIEKGGDAANTLKRISGSSGTAVASVTGLMAGLASLRGGGSALRAASTGFGIAALASVVEVTITSVGEKIHEGLGAMLAKATEAVFIASSVAGLVFKKDLIGMVSASVASVTAATKTALLVNAGVITAIPAQAAASARTQAVGGFIAGMIGQFNKVKDLILNSAVGKAAFQTPWGKAITGALVAVTAAYTFFGKDLGQQINALSNDLAKTGEEIKKAGVTLENTKQDKAQYEKLTRSFDHLTQVRNDFFARNMEDVKGREAEVSDAIDKLKNVSTDLQGSQMVTGIKALAAKLGATFGKDFSTNELINIVNEQGAVVASAEGARAALYQKLTEAYETSDRTDEQQALLTSFEKLDIAQKNTILNQVSGANEAGAFLGTLKSFSGQMQTEVYAKLKELEDRKLEQEREKLGIQVQKAIQEGGFAEVYAKVLQAAKDGDVKLLQAYKEEILKAQENSKNKIGDDVVNFFMDFAKGYHDWAQHNRDMISEEFSSIGNSIFPALKDFFSKDLPGKIKAALNTALDVASGYALGKAVKDSLFKDEKTKSKVPGELPEFIDKATQSALSNNHKKVVENFEKLAKDITTSGDRFSHSLSPERAAQLGLATDTVVAKQRDIATQLSGLSMKWKDVYDSAVNTGKSSTDVVKYLEAQAAISKDFPKVLQDTLDTYKKRLKEEQGFEEDVVRLGKSLNERANLIEQGVKDEDNYMSQAKQAEREVYRLTDALKDTSLSEEKIAELSTKRQVQMDTAATLTGFVGELQQKNAKLIEDQSNEQKQYNEAISHTTGAVQEQAKTADEINKIYKAIKDKADLRLASEDARLLSDKAEKDRQAALGDQNNPAKLSSDATERDIELATKRAELHKKVTDQVLLDLDRERKAEIKAGTEEGVANEKFMGEKRDRLQEFVKFHQEAYDKLLSDEQQHAQAVRQLEQTLSDAKRSDAEFKRGLRRNELADEDKLYYDKVNIQKDYAEATKTLNQGNYEDGKKLIDAAISDQQGYVTALQSSGEGTYTAEADLAKMTDKRNSALQDQINLQKQAQQAAKEAADAELSAINTLTIAITQLSSILAGVDMGDKVKNQALDAKVAVGGLGEAITTLPSAEVQIGVAVATEAINFLKASIDNVASGDPQQVQVFVDQASSKIDKLRSAIKSVADSNAPPEVKLEARDALKKVDALENTIANVGSARTPSEVQIAIEEAKTKLGDLQGVVDNLKQGKAPVVDVDNNQALGGISAVKASLDSLQDKTVTITTVHREVNASKAPQQNAKGGPIKGTGTGTSDSILSWLSNGEYVIPAQAVQKVGVPFLNKVKDGQIPGYALGGEVTAQQRRREQIAAETAAEDAAYLQGLQNSKDADAAKKLADESRSYSSTWEQLAGQNPEALKAVAYFKGKGSQGLDELSKASYQAMRHPNGAYDFPALIIMAYKEAMIQVENARVSNRAPNITPQQFKDQQQNTLNQQIRERITQPQPVNMGAMSSTLLSKAPILGDINKMVAQVPSLLKSSISSNIQQNSGSNTQNHVIEIRSDTGQTATVSANEQNMGHLLDVLKSLKGVSI